MGVRKDQRAWTADDLDKLGDMLSGKAHSVPEIAAALDRTPKAIRSRASVLDLSLPGIYRGKPLPHKVQWANVRSVTDEVASDVLTSWRAQQCQKRI